MALKRPVTEAVRRITKNRFELQKGQAMVKRWEARIRRAEHAMLERTSLRELIK